MFCDYLYCTIISSAPFLWYEHLKGKTFAVTGMTEYFYEEKWEDSIFIDHERSDAMVLKKDVEIFGFDQMIIEL